MEMKSKLKIAIIVFIIASIFTAMQIYFICYIASFFYPFGARSCDEITEIFYDNQDYFEEAVNIILNDKYPWGNINVFAVKHSHYWGFLTPNKCEIDDDRDCPQNDKDITKNKIENSSIKYIFRKLDFTAVSCCKEYISFKDRSTFKFNNGIIYLKDGVSTDQPKYEQYSFKHLTDNWYYYEAKYGTQD